MLKNLSTGSVNSGNQFCHLQRATKPIKTATRTTRTKSVIKNFFIATNPLLKFVGVEKWNRTTIIPAIHTIITKAVFHH